MKTKVKTVETIPVVKKKKYVKPILKAYEVKQASFIAASGFKPGGTVTVGYKDIDQCVQISGVVSDDELITMIKDSRNQSYTGCIDKGNAGEGESCTNTGLLSMCGYQGTVTIADEENKLFNIKFSTNKSNKCNNCR